MRFRLLVFLVGFAVAGHVAAAVAKTLYRVTVTRDSAGIPHVSASDFGSLGYGEGYAFAQDNLCGLAEDVVTLRGQRTRYFGAGGVAAGYANGARDPNPASDLYWTEVRSTGRLAGLIRGLRPELRDLYAGYAGGFNAWMRSPRFRDPTCKGKPWVKPITLEDLYLRGYQLQTFASSGVFESGLVEAQPPARAGASADAGTGGGLVRLRRMLDGGSDPGLGSNAIGLGSRGTRPGIAGMVLANPHFPWRGSERFWMAQLTVPGRYNVLGGTLFGFPLIGVGFNRHLAWASTNSTGRRFAVIKLKLAAGNPIAYVLDGKTIAMTKRVVRSNGSPHTFYSTRFGPVFDLPQAGYTWTSSTAYALFDADAQSLSAAANEYLAIGRATSVHGLLAVLRRYLAIPEFNIISADDHGQTLYANVGAYPGATQALIDRCIPSGVPQIAYQTGGLVTLDGSTSACELRSDPVAPRPHILGARSLPATIRTDYVENSNDSYWLANPDHPFPHHSAILGPYGNAQLFRTRQGNQMVKARLAGTDGYGPSGFDTRSMERMLGAFSYYGGKLIAPQLAAACEQHPSITLPSGAVVDVRAACPALRSYHGTGRLNDPGAWLFTTWLNDIPSGFPWRDAFDPADPLSTPKLLDPHAPDTLNALAEAVVELTTHHVALNATLGQVVYTRQTGSRTAISGCFGCFETINASHGTPGDAAPYGQIIFGDSLLMFTELSKNGPRSVGTLTYSQATDPTSKWHSNLTRLYARGRFVPLGYTATDLRSKTGARTQRLTAIR